MARFTLPRDLYHGKGALEALKTFKGKKAIICVGQGPWELPDSTRELDGILKSKGIDAWVDYWGFDCSHDWYWWYRQVEYFVPYLLESSGGAVRES